MEASSHHAELGVSKYYFDTDEYGIINSFPTKISPHKYGIGESYISWV